MTFKGAFDLAIATLGADATLSGYGVQILEGVHALADPRELAKTFATQFADSRFVVIVEHPAAAVLSEGAPAGHLLTTLSLVLVENPALRDGVTHSLDIVQAISEALYLAPVGTPLAAKFRPAPEHYQYLGDEHGNLYQRFNYTIPTTLDARPFTRPTPLAVGS
jgi:hypothetical protein